MSLTLMGIVALGMTVSPLRGNRFAITLRAAAERLTARWRPKRPVGATLSGMDAFMARRKAPVVIAAWMLAGSAFVGFVAFAKHEDPAVLYAKGLSHFQNDEHARSRELFARVIAGYPETASASNASYFQAVTYFKQREFQQAAEAFQGLIRRYPESQWVPEASYHLALCAAELEGEEHARPAFELVIAKFPTTRWAEYARTRLSEPDAVAGRGAAGPGDAYGEAMTFFDRGAYAEARTLFASVIEPDPSSRRAELAAYFYAVSFFKEARFRETIDEFTRFINAYAGSDYVPEASYHIGLSHEQLREPGKAREAFENVIRSYPDSRWAGYAKERLRERAIAQSQLG
jgi:TolA-binding protein